MRNKITQSFTVAALLGLMHPQIHAQGAIELQEVVVTAQKREQSIRDVGMSISAASSEKIQATGVRDAGDLGRLVPGFTSATGVFGAPVYSLRGVNFNSFQYSAPPTVSTYLDEAVLPYSIMGQALFLDVERVEVLKGPQGTLFGQNATAGSINVIAAKPTEVLSAGVKLDVDNWGETFAEGFVSGPLSDTLLARLSASTTQFGGWQRGYHLNRKKNGDQDKLSGRLLLEWAPTDQLDVSVNLNTSRDRSELQQPQAFLIDPVNPAAASPEFLSYQNNRPRKARDADIDRGFNTRADDRMSQAVVRVDYEFNDVFTFTSITNYLDSRYRQPRDVDGTAVVMQEDLIKAEIESFNQEFRLAGDHPDAGVNYVIGLSYGDDDITEGVYNSYAGYTGFPPGAEVEWKYDLTQKAISIFGSIDYEVTNRLTLTTGARYTETEQSIYGCTFDAGAWIFASTIGGIAGMFDPSVSSAYVPGGCATIDDTGNPPTLLPKYADNKQKEDNVSWRMALNYDLTDNVMTYISASRGYKAGTYSVIINLFDSGVTPVSQEKLTAYEVGTKMTFFNNRLQLDMAAFHYDYVDQQIFSFQPVLGGVLNNSTLINLPKSELDGFEVSFSALPLPGLQVSGGATYIKSKIKSFSGFDFAGEYLDFSGSDFAYSPPWSANLDVEYRFPLDGGSEVFLGSSIEYRDSAYADLGENSDFGIPSYTVVDARAGILLRNGLQVFVYGRNLTNEYYWDSVASFGDGAARFAAAPRTWGVNMSYSF